jgi:CspA family cold shock protein
LEADLPRIAGACHSVSGDTSPCHLAVVRAFYFANDRELFVATGTVKWFNPTKGYGFIQPQGGGKDVFVHISAVERAGLSTLNEGAQVEYEIVSNRGKESAENLKVR